MSWECPHCHGFQKITLEHATETWFVGKCIQCKGLSLVRYQPKKEIPCPVSPPPFKKQKLLKTKPAFFLPDPLPTPAMKTPLENKKWAKLGIFLIVFGVYFYSTRETKSQIERKLDFAPVKTTPDYSKFPEGKLYSVDETQKNTPEKLKLIKKWVVLRSGPGIKFKKVSTENFGSIFEIVEKGKDWVKIYIDPEKKTTAWVKAEFTQLIGLQLE